MDEGLPSPYAENILREMDLDGKVGLRSAPRTLLDEARQRTRGYPRALEALFALLSADRDTGLQDVLKETARLLPENVVEVLVGEAFSRLEPAAQRVMQGAGDLRPPRHSHRPGLPVAAVSARREQRAMGHQGRR